MPTQRTGDGLPATNDATNDATDDATDDAAGRAAADREAVRVGALNDQSLGNLSPEGNGAATGSPAAAANGGGGGRGSGRRPNAVKNPDAPLGQLALALREVRGADPGGTLKMAREALEEKIAHRWPENKEPAPPSGSVKEAENGTRLIGAGRTFYELYLEVLEAKELQRAEVWRLLDCAGARPDAEPGGPDGAGNSAPDGPQRVTLPGDSDAEDTPAPRQLEARPDHWHLVYTGLAGMLILALIVCLLLWARSMAPRPELPISPGPIVGGLEQPTPGSVCVEQPGSRRPPLCPGMISNPAAVRPEFELEPVLGSLSEQNRQVYADPEQPEAVTLIYALALPDEPSSFSSALRHELEGVALAQLRANTDVSGLGDRPKIRVEVFYTGANNDQWLSALQPILARGADPKYPIVGVLGLGQSVTSTRLLIDALGRRGIPVFGTRLTADVLTAIPPDPATGASPIPPTLLRLAPPNKVLTDTAADQLRRRSNRVTLAVDINGDDFYNRSLETSFRQVLATKPGAVLLPTLTYNSADSGVSSALVNSVADMCSRDRPDTVYVAGRGVDIQKLLAVIADAPACQGPPITVLTGDDGVDVLNQLRRARTQPAPAQDRDRGNAALIRAFDSGKFVFRYTALAHPALWDSYYASEVYRASRSSFDATRATDPSLDEGASLMGYDTTLTAVSCVRRAASQATPTPTAQQTLQGCRTITREKPVYGATGLIFFNPQGQALSRPVPIVEVRRDGSAPVLNNN